MALPNGVRLFAALAVDTSAETHLHERLDGLQTAHPELRWVPPARWHVTLQFLGSCGPPEVARQAARWQRRAARSHPLALRLHGSGAFPRIHQARVLWTGLVGDVDGLARLAAFDQHAHLTLARTRASSDLTGICDELSAYDGPEWTATELLLVESRLGAARDGGPRYVPMEHIPLG
ncbi:MAG: RNA 2',3'-cyclic phosphodiesterase [Sciscionella sp.]